MNRELLIVVPILWMIGILVSVVFEEGASKRTPPHKLRFPRCFAVIGSGMPLACGWLIYEMFRAEDWEEAKLLYLVLISLFFLLGIGGVWLILHALNWGIDIKDDRIVYRNFLRFTRTVYYTEITQIEHREPRFVNKGDRNRFRRGWLNIFYGSKRISSYRIYIGKRFITVDSVVYNYNSSVPRILKAMKKQGITCPVTTRKTWFS